MAKHNYTYRAAGKPEPKLMGQELDKIYPQFFSKAKAFFSTKEGMAEYIEWLKSIPEDSVLAACKAELPEAEAQYQKMLEVAV